MNHIRAITLGAVSISLALVGAGSAAAEDPSEDAKCHGQRATYVGTGGNDVVSDETEDYGRNPVFVMGDGEDEVQMGLGDLRYSDLARLTLIGTAGDDILRGGNSNDSIDGGRGGDAEYGLGGIDNLRGGTGRDQLHGQRGSDRMLGGSGRDELNGDMPSYPHGKDFANGGDGRDDCEAEIKRNCER